MRALSTLPCFFTELLNWIGDLFLHGQMFYTFIFVPCRCSKCVCVVKPVSCF